MESESIDNEMFQRNDLMKKLDTESDQVVKVNILGGMMLIITSAFFKWMQWNNCEFC